MDTVEDIENLTEDDKDEGYLSFRSSIRTYEVAEIPLIFDHMASSLQPKPGEAAKLFGQAAMNLGTHSPKLVRSKAETVALNIPPRSGNYGERLVFAGNAALGKYVKVLMRPIAIAGQHGEANLIERLVSGDLHVGALKSSFSAAFGPDALAAVLEALATRYDRSANATLHPENFPIIYIPGPHGSDLQSTLLAPTESYDIMAKLRFSAGRKKDPDIQDSAPAEQDGTPAGEVVHSETEPDPGEPARPAIDWRIFTKSEVSGKIRNIAMQLSPDRQRFRAEMPDVMSRMEASLWRYANGHGGFPRFRNEWATDLIQIYARAYDRNLGGLVPVTPEMTATLDRMADQLIRAAVAHRVEVDVAATDFGGEPDTREAPSIPEILRTLPVRKEDRAITFKVLGSTHFDSRLDLAGEH